MPILPKKMVLKLGFSPCPNDTFIFDALVHGKIPCGDVTFRAVLEDIETLNIMAVAARMDMTKISFFAFADLRDKYCLLHSGAALGRGCGPLVISRDLESMEQMAGKRIAIPGKLTTAFFLLQLYNSNLARNLTVMPFNFIVEAVREGTVDAGLIIHESRFTYHQYGLRALIDLGERWERETALPIPLGGILMKRSLGSELIEKVDLILKNSVSYAFDHREESREYIKKHAQEIADEVIEEHINLYVNDFSLDLGDEGERAVRELFRRGETAGIIEKKDQPLFI